MRHRAMIVLWLWATVVSWASDSLLPIPTPAEQRKSEQLVRDLFQDEYAQHDASSRLALAQKLIRTGRGTRNDAVTQYVLFWEAADLAAQAGDVPTAFAAIDALGGGFSVDALPLRVDVLSAVDGRASTREASRTVAGEYLSLAEVAVAADRYDIATRVLTAADLAARRSFDLPLLRQVAQRSQDVRELQAEHSRFVNAVKLLQRRPADPEANLVMGRYYCFVKGDWEKGLPQLSLGGDVELRALAEREFDQPSRATAEAALGDHWWEYAARCNGLVKIRVQQRAAYWYRRALPSLDGLAKVWVEKRLAQVPVSQQVQTVHEEGLLLYCSFQPDAGDGVFDQSGNNNHGVCHGAKFTEEGRTGGGMKFDGQKDFLRFKFPAGFSRTNFTVEAWVKPLGPVTFQTQIVGQGGGAVQLCLRPGRSGVRPCVLFKARYEHTFPEALADLEIPIGGFTHLAGTWDGKSLKLYVGGRLVAEQMTSRTPAVVTCPLDVGGFGEQPPTDGCDGFPPQQFFFGVIDEVRIYSRTLTAEEIAAAVRPTKDNSRP